MIPVNPDTLIRRPRSHWFSVRAGMRSEISRHLFPNASWADASKASSSTVQAPKLMLRNRT